MRRHLLTLALAGVFGLVVSAAGAQACHHKGHATCGTPAPCAAAAPACEPAPAPVCEPAPTCAPKKKCGLFSGLGHKGGGLGLCHKKAACAPACEPAPAPCVATVSYGYSYAAPVTLTYATPQGTYAAAQATTAAPQAPAKMMPTAAPQAPTKVVPVAPAPQAPGK